MSTWRPVVEQAEMAVKAEVSLADKDGFCYLLLVRPERQASVAMRLGRWPLLEDVMALSVADADVGSPSGLQLVRKGEVVHIQPLTQPAVGEVVADVLTMVAAQFTGTGSKAIAKGTLGHHFCLPVPPRIVGQWDGRAYVGGEARELVVRPSNQENTDESRVKAAKSALPDVVAAKRASRVGFAWVSAVEEFCQDSYLNVGGSSVVVFGNEGVGSSHSLALSVPGRAIVQLPEGWKLSVGGTTVGHEGVTTMFGFRGRCKVRLQPPLGHSGQPEAVVITGRRVDWALDVMLNPKSTDARFVRAVDLPLVVLRVPKAVQREPCLVEPSCVRITDPLERWNAMEEVRCESRIANASCLLGGAGLIAVKNFRSSGVAVLELGKFVTLDTSEAGVVISADVGAYLHRPKLVTDDVDFEWSVRRLECVDDYCMDDGGPSDSEFSDAI